MRIKEKIENINYCETKHFFSKRASKFNENNPYSVTMYQDNNVDLVKARNEAEIKKLLPKISITKESKVLDVACGIGRWADALPDNIIEYCGVDFSCELIEIANRRNQKSNFFFYEGAANEIEHVLRENKKGKYNRFLLIGILMYLNDKDVESVLKQVENNCEEHGIICVREPIGLTERLTLKDFYSDELQDNYNAIYRNRDEMKINFEKVLFNRGFRIREEGFMFEGDALNNRKETAQYYFILER